MRNSLSDARIDSQHRSWCPAAGKPVLREGCDPASLAQLGRYALLGASMSLNFPNASRNYDPVRRCVSFWGHDSTFEVAFHVDEDALRRMSPEAPADEASLLHVFDANRARIERVAGQAYSRRRQNFLKLSASDF
jgi:hypothetical protein